ncbi:MAG: DUF222 domain-containing protein [Nocardioidaceae bacterium]
MKDNDDTAEPASDLPMPEFVDAAAMELVARLFTSSIHDLDAAATLDLIMAGKRLTAMSEARLIDVAAHFADLHPAQSLDHRPGHDGTERDSGSTGGDTDYNHSADDSHGTDANHGAGGADDADDAAYEQVEGEAFEDEDVYGRWVGGHEKPPPAAERVIRPGGVGTPTVTEFTPAQLGPILRVSTLSARFWLADALDLRHRLPRIYALVAAGSVDAFRARLVAQATRKLTLAQARMVEERVIGRMDKVTTVNLKRLVDTEVLQVDPAAADAERELARRALQVGISPGDDGVGDLWSRCDNHTLARIDQRLTTVAGWLAETGDASPARLRRVTALGLLADPGAVAALWQQVQATRTHRQDGDPAESVRSSGALPATVLYVHLRPGPDGQPRFEVERSGQIPAAALTPDWARNLLGHSHVTIRPVLDLAVVPPTDAYVPTPTQREALHLLHGSCYFPFCHQTSRGTDADHLMPAPRGPTTMSNLGPADRHHHRCKTHAPGWQVSQPFLGLFVWRSPTGHHYVVTSLGTTSLGRTNAG